MFGICSAKIEWATAQSVFGMHHITIGPVPLLYKLFSVWVALHLAHCVTLGRKGKITL